VQTYKTSGSHHDIGLSIGKRFSDGINHAMTKNKTLQEIYLPFCRSPEGRDLYEQLLSIHKEAYPEYLLEIEGIAEGAGRPFEEIFLINLRGEFRSYTKAKPDQGCSTISVLTDQVAAFGHNEDGSEYFRENAYVVEASVTGKPSFRAFSYPGFLCGNAFGFNSEGICFCNNDVRPQKVQAGIGRHFMARSLFEATSIDDAIERVTPQMRAAGFNYTVGSVKERRIVNVAVSPSNHSITEIDGVDYRANHYTDLDGIAQVIGTSSQVRVDRAQGLLYQLDPSNKTDLLEILSDHDNPEYPIFRNGNPPDDIATLCTCLFDLDTRQCAIYTGHPIEEADRCVEFPLMW
jgi:hypothetical protein